MIRKRRSKTIIIFKLNIYSINGKRQRHIIKKSVRKPIKKIQKRRTVMKSNKVGGLSKGFPIGLATVAVAAALAYYYYSAEERRISRAIVSLAASARQMPGYR